MFDLAEFERVQISKELRSFIEECLIVELDERPTIDKLNQHIFIQRYKQNDLSTKVRSVEEEDDIAINCYKLQISCVLNEIVHRHCTFNATKLRLVQSIEDDFIKAM